MTPGARVAAAIGVLDAVRAGAPAEQALTNWARGARYAGSGDRAAVRDHVFTVLRRWSCCAARGGGKDGRALLIGLLRETGVDPDTVFTGRGHDPDPLAAAERAAGRAPNPRRRATCPAGSGRASQTRSGPTRRPPPSRCATARRSPCG